MITTLPGFCITENDNLVGVITRHDLHLKLSGPYGYSLYANKHIKNIMSREFMCVDFKTPIDVVSKIAMQREQDKLYDFITITKDGKYYGIVTVKDLLEKTIQMEVLNAKHLNPLSELPGNLLIEQYLEHCITSKNDFCVLYFDIDNFKAYNDVYGFEKGDIVIKRMTELLKKIIPRDEFIGHIGGDDFIAVLFINKDIENLCKNIISEFDKVILKLLQSK
jgi:GGDEF domain-containing protein